MEKEKKKFEEEKIVPRLTRRNFIKTAGKTAGMVALGMTAIGCDDLSSLENYITSQVPDTNDFDVVVIGTGMGGSAAGAICAMNGLKTLILEKNEVPGGSCSYYYKDGFRVDTGAHMFIQANRGPFGDLTKRLKLGQSIDFVQARNTLHLKGCNMNFILPKTLIGRGMVVPWILAQTRINPVHYPSILALLSAITVMPMRQIEKLDTVSMEAFVSRFTPNKDIQSIMGGILGLMVILPAHQASAGESIWNLQKLIWGMSVSYPKGGASVIPETFLEGAKEYGGQVLMNAGVRNIVVNNGKVEAVILEDGRKIKTKAVISTSSVKDTVLKMVGEQYFPETFVEQTKNITPSYTAVQVKLALKKKVINAGCLISGAPVKAKGNLIAPFVPTAFDNAANGIQGKYIPIYAPVPTSFDKSLAPEGCQIVTAVALAPNLETEYVDPPDVWIQGMMDTLFEAMPELEENIVFYDTWTVKRMADWVGKSDGSAISTGQSTDQAGVNRPGHETPIQGLYLAGDGAGSARGVGTELACQSGMDCADLITEHFQDHLLSKVNVA